MTNELKPCPFCGGEAKYREITGEYVSWVGCRECEVWFEGEHLTDKAPITAWNTRATPKVKPLVWFGQPDTTYKAESFAGVYRCYPNMLGSWTLDDGMSVSAHANPIDAKRAGDLEETRRILSAL